MVLQIATVMGRWDQMKTSRDGYRKGGHPLMAAKGLSWDHKTGRTAALLAVIAVVASLFTIPATAASAATPDPIDVIVTEAHPASDSAERLVESLGGSVGDHLAIIGAFTAQVPASAFDVLSTSDAVESVAVDGSVQLQSTADWANDTVTYQDSGSMFKTAKFVLARTFWDAGYTGQGVDVALIDSGVAPVQGLTEPGKIVNGPDLSFESQNSDFRYLDTFGHGTHMAGIIAGRDPGVTNPWNDTKTKFVGIAPGARVVNVKVAGYDGAVDVSQVIAGIDWVVQHKNSNGLNIRVLNLSFGTDSVQAAQLDPLSHAVEQAWKAGIVVVVAAGNDGGLVPLRMPASNPNVIAVGAYDSNGTNITGDDFLTTFTNCGTNGRTYDVVAPGRSILSLRNPGSLADMENPGAVVDDRLFRGSGTSQSAAVVSGAVALMLEQRPELSPDQVKSLIVSTADYLGQRPDRGCPRKTMLDLREIFSTPAPSTSQTHPSSTGLGSLEASRGSDHVELDGVALTGERDIFGGPWNGTSWSTAAAQGTSWSGGTWNGTSWSGTSWSGTSWSGLSWSGTSWSGTSWSGTSWSGTSWSDKTWSGTSWSGTSWSGTSWSGTSWSGLSWSSAGWGDTASGVRWD
ncbi:MAG: S8 family serine peptidase [Acidimicrobiia bacterium]|nr:S8 family serine peptidase [Acidimicrobiia bacterium]